MIVVWTAVFFIVSAATNSHLIAAALVAVSGAIVDFVIDRDWQQALLMGGGYVIVSASFSGMLAKAMLMIFG